MLGLFGRFWTRQPAEPSQPSDETQSALPCNLQLEELDGLWDRHSNVLQRGIRRLSLAQQEQKDALVRIENTLRGALAAGTSESVSFPLSEVLAILDDLDRAEQSVGDADAVARAVARCAERICTNAQWTPIAQIGQQYAKRGTEIVDSVAAQSPAGLVCAVVRQGYLGPGERLIREAKVVVSAAADRHDDAPSDTET